MRRLMFPSFFCLLLLFLAGCLWDATEDSPDYLPLDDSEFPYANLPRVVIETEDFHDVRDRETELVSRLQIYGAREPESEVMSLTVRGRGNSSFMMPKYGMKLEFTDKVSLFGMPRSRDWALIANFGDKTHLRNYMMTRLSEWLGARYTPRMQFVEVFLNRKYMGLYLLSETVKVAKDRVNIAENDSSFLFEKEDSKKLDSPFVTTGNNYSFHVKSPKNLSEVSAKMLTQHLNDFEQRLLGNIRRDSTTIEDWIDLDDYLLHYWVQEFSKNEDGNFARSVFMTWEKGGTIHFGPLWDFDLAFGNASREENKPADAWYIRNYRWHDWIFRDLVVREKSKNFWKERRGTFAALIDSVPLYKDMISEAVKNEYRRWPVIKNTENWALKDPFDSYEDAVEYMVEWMEKRYAWIDSQF